MLDQIKRYYYENKPVFVIILIGILIRLLYLWEYSSLPEWEQLTVDNNFHHNWALSILSGNILGDTTYFRAPLYIFYLAGIYKLFGISLWAVRLIGILPGIMAVFFTYLLGKRIYNRQIGYIAAIIHAIYPIIYYFESELLLDPLFLLLFEISIYYFIKWWDQNTGLSIFISGLFLSLASITRPTSLIIIPIVIIILFVSSQKKLQALKLILLFAVGVSLCILPIFARNMKVANDPVLIASQGGINLYLGNNDASDGISAVMPEPFGFNWRIKQITVHAEKELKRQLTPGQVSSYWTDKAIEWIMEHPKEFISLFVKKLYHNISNREISNNRYLEPFFNKVYLLRYNYLSFGLLFALAVVSILLTGSENRKAIFLWSVIILYMMVTSLFFFSSRFRLPLLPYFIILASHTLYVLRLHLKQKPKSALILVGVVILIGLFSYYPVVALPQGSTSQNIISKGLFYAAKGEHSKALLYFTRAKEIDPNAPETNLNIGAMYLELGNPDSAIHYLQLEKEAFPDHYKSEVNLASVYLTQGNYREAMAEITRAISKAPYDLNANVLHVRISDRFDTTSNGQFFTPTVQLAMRRTNFNIYLLNEAAVYMSNRNKMKEAEDILLLAINSTPPPIETDDASFLLVSPNNPDVWNSQKAHSHYQLGYIHGLQGKFETAVSHSLKAIEINPELQEAYINLVSGYLSLSRLNEAVKILDDALHKFPNNKNLLQIKQYLQR